VERGHQRGRGTLTEFFADSYAILAYLQGDPGYVARFRGSLFHTSILNLYEVHYSLVSRGVQESEAMESLAPFETSASPPDWPVLRDASRLRAALKVEGRSCSYIDAAGLAMARKMGLPFLTGDAAFEGVDGVEFLREQAPSRRRGQRRP
jgi:predicted nucleic acid-binding protein